MELEHLLLCLPSELGYILLLVPPPSEVVWGLGLGYPELFVPPPSEVVQGFDWQFRLLSCGAHWRQFLKLPIHYLSVGQVVN